VALDAIVNANGVGVAATRFAVQVAMLGKTQLDDESVPAAATPVPASAAPQTTTPRTPVLNDA
jgi:hypothetical protein